MRLLGLMVVAGALMASASAQAGMKEFTYADLGVRKDFPGDPPPVRTKGTYKTIIVNKPCPESTSGCGVPADIITSTAVKGAVYKLTVVPLQDMIEKSSSIMGECNYNSMIQGSKLLMDASTEIGLNKDGVYGRWASVNMPNGDRKITVCYFTKGNLYQLESTITKENEDYPDSQDAFRFTNSIDFNVDPCRDAASIRNGLTTPGEKQVAVPASCVVPPRAGGGAARGAAGGAAAGGGRAAN